MDKIKVYLQYPWKFSDSSYYKNILEFPPNKVVYINYKKNLVNIIGSSKKFEFYRVLKNLIRQILNLIKIPNLTYTFNKDCDLIHCAHCLSLNKKPWVLDTETYDRIAATGRIAYSRFGKFIIRKLLESKYCKKIICWSEDCKKTFEEAFPNQEKILKKITILHFALPKFEFKKIPHGSLNVLFVARWFYAKGGRQTLEVFKRLSNKFRRVNFIFICPTPKDLKEKYQNSRIRILDLVPQEKLFEEIYPSSDIFFYPGFGDSYGFAVPEAMMFGLPIITTNTFAKRELVTDGKSGFLIDLPSNWKGYHDMNEELLKKFEEKTSLLIENEKLRVRMGKNARKEAEKKFSIDKRNKLLTKIYFDAID
ncbi:MAG: glycosyltransferase family 4 protein [Candidatus Pacearchaeota archaeon]